MLIIHLIAAAPEGGTANPAATLMMMMGFIAIFYFLFFRPQRKQQQEHKKLVEDLKKGDQVTTVGGIVGTIVHLTDDRMTVKTGDTRIEVERSKIGSVSAADSGVDVIREIRLYGDPVLREEAAPIESFDDALERLINDLIETMYNADGIGLATPQVGIPLRVFVYDIRDPDVGVGVLMNPEIVESDGSAKDEEGCLSLPGLTEIVSRPESIVVRGIDRDQNQIEIEAEGLLSRCIQHESDHLNGVLFIDRVSPLKRRLLIRKWQKRDAD